MEQDGAEDEAWAWVENVSLHIALPEIYKLPLDNINLSKRKRNSL